VFQQFEQVQQSPQQQFRRAKPQRGLQHGVQQLGAQQGCGQHGAHSVTVTGTLRQTLRHTV
jgi:hypothetical protein